MSFDSYIKPQHEVKVYAKILLGMIPGSSSGNANTNNKNFVTYSPQNY